MKKFLTVLLALSVVFTYSFSAVGTVFADTKEDQLAKLNDAKALAEKMVNTYFDDALEGAIADTKTDVGTTVSTTTFKDAEFEAAWKAVDAKAALTKFINDKYVAEAKTFTDSGTAATDVAAYAATVFSGISNKNADGTKELTASEITTNIKNVINTECKKAAYLKLYNTKRAELLTAYDRVDYSLYLDQVDPDDADGRTYLKIAQDTVEKAKKDINDNSTMTPADDVASFGKTNIVFGIASIENKIKTDLEALTYEGTTYETGYYKVNGVETAEEVAAGDRQDAADLASLKAAIQQAYVTAMNGGADKANADAYVTVSNYLAEKGFITAAPTYEGTDWKTPVKNIEDLTAYAAKYKAEKDATGAFVRDAEAVDAEVEKATNETYGALVPAATIPADKKQSIKDAEDNIAAMSVKTDAASLAFEKEAAKAAVEKAKANVIDEYYDLEAKKVEAKFAEIIAEIEAATTTAKVATAKAKIKDTTSAIKTDWSIKAKDDVDNDTVKFIDDDKDAIDNYISYVNTGKTILDDGYIDATPAQITDALTKIYGEAGARTQAEVDALNVDAATVVATLPTAGAKKAAKKAAEDAINALPAQATEADQAAVEAALKAVEDYTAMGGVVDNTLTQKLNKAVEDVVADELKNETIAFAKADKTDKAALKDLAEKVDATIKFAKDSGVNTMGIAISSSKLNNLKDDISKEDPTDKGALQKIRDAELANVIKLINAIPLNVTEADKATVEAARKAYDEFVKEWTDYEVPYDAAKKVTNFRELALAEAALSLNEDPAKDVESLKITVSTKLYKGSKIRVKWTVKGDASNIDGYQVYKSTKAQKGYKFMGKTKKSYMDNKKNLKKGTRYFYKVRAYKVVDGVKYYSDWSNKGNRIYKK